MKKIIAWLRQLFGKRTLDDVAGATAAQAPPPAIPAAPKKIRSPEEIAARVERRKLYRLRERLAADANETLDRIAKLSTFGADPHARADYAQLLAELDGVDFLFLDYVDEMPGSSEWGIFNPEGEEAQFADVMWPIDIGVVVKKDWGLSFSHVKTADAKQLRGKIRIVPKKIVEIIMLQVDDEKKEWFVEKDYAGLIGNKWIALDDGMTAIRSHNLAGEAGVTRWMKKKTREEFHSTASTAFSVALTERYSWHAAMGFDSGPRLLVPTSPGACLDLFKNRALGDAEKRRAALRHWVHTHFRDNDTTGLTYVRDHLRGITNFKWYDLGCEIIVSEFDLEKNELFKLEAEEWRKKRKHNRGVRVRLKERRTTSPEIKEKANESSNSEKRAT